MNHDDKVCYCYDVSLRKLWNFARGRQLSRPSQMSQCLGAGTGCGWCIPTLQRIFEQAREGNEAPNLDLTPGEYAERRRAYINEGKPKNTFG